MTRERPPIGIDFFCGVGGMSLGFEQAGVEVVAAFDSETRHVQTYLANFPNGKAYVLDLSKASGKDIRRFAGIGNRTIDVLFGGPPCQGFSVGGRRDLGDPRNSLILHFARLIRELRPRYFVVENVAGLLMGRAVEVVKSFRRRIRRAGYDLVEPIQVLNAADYGVPQRRKRCFILGHRKGIAAPKYPVRRGIVGGGGKERFPNVADAIGDLPVVEDHSDLFETDGCSGRLGRPGFYAKIMRRERPGAKGGNRLGHKNSSVLTGCLRTRHGKETVRRFRRTKRGEAEPISRFIRLKADDVAPTIRAGTGSDHGSHTAPRPIHYERSRCITVREAARLHSFPDWYQFEKTRWHAFRQIGNSVPPTLAAAVAEAVVHCCLGREMPA